MELVKLQGHKYVDIMKIDVEGSELTVLQEFLNDIRFRKLGVSIIIVEFHFFEVKF